MARGLREGDGGPHLITFHPRGGDSSSACFHDERLARLQHAPERPQSSSTPRRYDETEGRLRPDADEAGARRRADLRGPPRLVQRRRSSATRSPPTSGVPLYWDLFTGAFGHTYGHHSVWQIMAPGRTPMNNPLMPWTEAIDQPGAAQMQHGRALIESRPFLTRIPDDGLIVPAAVPTGVPGAGRVSVRGDA